MKNKITKISSAFVLCSLFACSHAAKQSAAPQPATDAKMTIAKPEKISAKHSPAEGALICTKGKDERSVEIVTEGAGCLVRYTKMGAAKDVFTTKKGTQGCEEIRTRIKGKLEAVNFSCK